MANQRNRQPGFTLIELVITVTILGILSTIAMPSFVSFLRNTQVRTASESILQGLQLARAEAVRRNTQVNFVVGADTAWSVATVAGVAIQNKPAREGSPNVVLTLAPATSTTVTYNSFGRIVNGAAALTQIDFSATGKTVSRRIILTAGGQVQLCDPSILTAGDPRKC